MTHCFRLNQMDKRDERVIDNIRAKLEASGHNKQWLAKRMGITPQSLSRVLNKHSPPARSTITAAAEAFECSVSELYGEEPSAISRRLESLEKARKKAEPSISDSIAVLELYRSCKDDRSRKLARLLLGSDPKDLALETKDLDLARKIRELLDDEKDA